MAGRGVLINSVINALPIYTLSFYKAPKKILNEVCSIQRKFLWGGGDLKRSINWVSWDTVCKSREEGGLGVKNMEIMNVALLSKWKWRILTDKDAVWRDLLEVRYGNIKLKVLVGDSLVVQKKDSIWWRDLIISDNYDNLLLDNFSSAVLVSVGNGVSTPLWYANWTGQRSLMERYPSLFSMAHNHIQNIASAGFENSCWKWALHNIFVAGSAAFLVAENDYGVAGDAGHWSGRVSVQGGGAVVPAAAAAMTVAGSEGVQQVFSEFRELFGLLAMLKEETDSFSWRLTSDEIFSVKSCYDFFKANMSGPSLNADKVRALSHLWKVKVPSKILLFCLRFIHNRLATRDHLVSRGILIEGSDSKCVICSMAEESRVHLFSDCVVSLRVWRRVYMWLAVGDLLSLEDFIEFFYNCAKVHCPSKRAILSVVWLATIWTLWIKRNAIVFKDESFSFIECMSEIVIISWNWLGSFYKKVPLCNYFGWNTQPLLCFAL
ncbi:uncharacterized protein LOC131638121 [Vicia villosa]|uniref:uncharacterized protein LOC131638121 n=1 Tax=Vicia villosa TaxID=3911 RepID=UPI00273B4407|nr:uncharacterized protein LOC131638121 [Vicia villosa]